MMDLESTIVAAGGTAVTAGNVNDALAVADDPAVSLAMIDVKLGCGITCERVCERLVELGVPFIFYTGYHDPAVLLRWPDAPLIEKPSPAAVIVNALAEITFSNTVSRRHSGRITSSTDIPC